jgi:hypothetical protein
LKEKFEKNICHGEVSGRVIYGVILVKSGHGRPGKIKKAPFFFDFAFVSEFDGP